MSTYSPAIWRPRTSDMAMTSRTRSVFRPLSTSCTVLVERAATCHWISAPGRGTKGISKPKSSLTSAATGLTPWNRESFGGMSMEVKVGGRMKAKPARGSRASTKIIT